MYTLRIGISGAVARSKAMFRLLVSSNLMTLLVTIYNADTVAGVDVAMSDRLAQAMCRSLDDQKLGRLQGSSGHSGGACHYWKRGCDSNSPACVTGSSWKVLSCSNKGSAGRRSDSSENAGSQGSPDSASSQSTSKTGSFTGRSGSGTSELGSPAGKNGSPAGKSGSPAGKSGSPVGKNGSPAGRNGGTSGRSGSPTSGNKRVEGGTEDESRVIGGNNALPHIHPYLVTFFVMFEPNPRFLGSIYNPHTIIVSSKILKEVLTEIKNDFLKLRIFAGKHNISAAENTEQFRFMCNYSHYSQGDTGPQYSLVHLYEPFYFNEYVGKIRLADAAQAATLTKTCRFPGWGKTAAGGTYPEVLQEAVAQTKSSCSGSVSANEFCSPPVYCDGDAGSPLICTDKKRIYASGLATGTPPDCTSESIFADLKRADFQDWLKQEYENAGALCRAPDHWDISDPIGRTS